MLNSVVPRVEPYQSSHRHSEAIALARATPSVHQFSVDGRTKRYRVAAMRFIAICALAVILAVNLVGFAFWAFCRFVGADVRVSGGLVTMAFSAVTVILCVRGSGWLRGSRPVALQI